VPEDALQCRCLLLDVAKSWQSGLPLPRSAAELLPHQRGAAHPRGSSVELQTASYLVERVPAGEDIVVRQNLLA
jgi:hypothetical protein